jgi:sugar phosphate isomerase/epimerase
MRLAFSRPTATEEEQRLLFRRFRSLGYDGLQLKVGQYQRYWDRPEEFTTAWGGFPGAASALIWGGRLDAEGGAALQRLFTFAAAVGAERIVFCHSVPREGLTQDDIRGFAQQLSDLGTEARSCGVRLSLHHHYNQPVMHREDFDAFFGAVEGNAVGLTVDTAHLVKSGVTDIAGVIRDFAAVLDNVHMKDFASGEFRVLGEGAIDFVPVFTALREVGYDGWLCADEESGSDMEDGMAACHRFLTAGLS